MGYFQMERERIEISEEEYENSTYKRKDDSIYETLKELSVNCNFQKIPTFDSKSDKVIEYKYYKLGKEKLIYLVGEEEYRYLMNMT